MLGQLVIFHPADLIGRVGAIAQWFTCVDVFFIHAHHAYDK